MLRRHFSSTDLILSFPGVCYQFSSLFTVRSCVLQVYDTQSSIRITLCKALAHGKYYYSILQASEPALEREVLLHKNNPHELQDVSPRRTCTMDL